jgi:hypothetical protein
VQDGSSGRDIIGAENHAGRQYIYIYFKLNLDLTAHTGSTPTHQHETATTHQHETAGIQAETSGGRSRPKPNPDRGGISSGRPMTSGDAAGSIPRLQPMAKSGQFWWRPDRFRRRPIVSSDGRPIPGGGELVRERRRRAGSAAALAGRAGARARGHQPIRPRPSGTGSAAEDGIRAPDATRTGRSRRGGQAELGRSGRRRTGRERGDQKDGGNARVAGARDGGTLTEL